MGDDSYLVLLPSPQPARKLCIGTEYITCCILLIQDSRLKQDRAEYEIVWPIALYTDKFSIGLVTQKYPLKRRVDCTLT